MVNLLDIESWLSRVGPKLLRLTGKVGKLYIDSQTLYRRQFVLLGRRIQLMIAPIYTFNCASFVIFPPAPRFNWKHFTGKESRNWGIFTVRNAWLERHTRLNDVLISPTTGEPKSESHKVSGSHTAAQIWPAHSIEHSRCDLHSWNETNASSEFEVPACCTLLPCWRSTRS